MRILFLGGTKFFGKRAVEFLLERGHDVTTYSRSPSVISRATHVAGERGDGTAIIDLLKEGDFDCVVDNIAYEAIDVVALVPVLASGSTRYVLTSSFVVYGNERAASLPVVRESDADLTMDDGDDYHNGKRRCEAVLHSAGDAFPWLVLRPSNVEGAGDPSNRCGFWIDRVLDGRGIIVPSDWPWNSKYPVLWCDDLANAIVLAVEADVASKTYNVAGELTTLTELLEVTAAAAGVPKPEVFYGPYEELVGLAGIPLRLPIQGKCVLDTSSIRTDLGFNSTPIGDWMSATVAWWRSAGLDSQYWDQRRAEIRAVQALHSGYRHGASPQPH